MTNLQDTVPLLTVPLGGYTPDEEAFKVIDARDFRELGPGWKDCSRFANSCKTCSLNVFIACAISAIILQTLAIALIYQKFCHLENRIQEQDAALKRLTTSKQGFSDEVNSKKVDKIKPTTDEPGRNEQKEIQAKATNVSHSRPKRGRCGGCRAFIQDEIEDALSDMWRPGVHLKGESQRPNPIFTASDAYFRWAPVEDTPRIGGISYDNRYIKIQQTGLYMVYSQVTVNGRSYAGGSTLRNPACGYDTILKRGQRTVVLLSSFKTQDDRGRSYLSLNNEQLDFYPLDTLSHQGIFWLEGQDKLAVRSSTHSFRDRFVVGPQNYFGAVLLSTA